VLDKSSSFILHTQQPMILAEIFNFDSGDEKNQIECKKAFTTYGALDYGLEYIVLGAVWMEPLKFEDDIPATQEVANKIAGVMRRMADWYEAYLNWEDNHSPEEFLEDED